jgi:hypothetical protein
MRIKTLTGSNIDQFQSFLIPAVSKILNFFVLHNTLYLLYQESETLNEINKTIRVEIIKGTHVDDFIPDLYKYWGTITESSPVLSTLVSGSSNFQMNIVNNTSIFHIFVDEILPLCEIRDKKLEQII